MKRTFTLVLCALTIAVAAQESEQEIKSKIRQVTVFLEGAPVKRQAQVSLKPGVSILNFTGISHRIDEQSIRAAATAGVKILSVSFRIDYLEEVKKPEKIAALEHERRRILAQIAQEKSMEDVYREEEVILKTNKSIGGAAKGVEIEELKEAMDYFRLRLMDIKKTLLAIDQRVREHNEALGRIEAQLKELSNQKIKPGGEIIIKVSTKSFAQTDLSIDYMVLEARWFPSYDIRAKDIQSPVGVTYKANIAQQSGEDWENVKLTISSGNPAETGTRPVIRPWYVGFNNTMTNRSAPVIGTVQASGTYASSVNA
ncbi:MAG TPA: mucoidy inhibitor MuiA family protein, partial [Ohtaekwangia sp.]|nr:mucoidy inhibitor MuiA family protein [Ohtaekwangia sp.]